MFFATWIAALGVIADSTATVIGAMLIAPLMTPIMATAAALVMGQPDGSLIEARTLPAIANPIADSIELPNLLHGRYGRYE